MREELVKAGYDVWEAGHGNQAMELLRTAQPDLIISDVLMPEMDGNTFYKAIRQNPRTKDIPFIIITARVNMRDYFEVIHVDAFIEKPFRLKELAIQVGDVLKKHPPKDRPPKAAFDATKGPQPASSQPVLSGTVGAVIDERQATAGKDDGLPSGDKVRVRPSDRERRQQMARTVRRRILLAEDSGTVAGEIGKHFLKMGYGVESVQSAEACIDAVYDLKPDLVVLSLLVNDTSAIDIAEKIKRIPQFNQVPIIIYQNVFKKNANGEQLFHSLSLEGNQLLQKIHTLLG